MEMSHAFHMTGDYLFAVKFHFFAAAAISLLLLCKKKGNLLLSSYIHFNFVIRDRISSSLGKDHHHLNSKMGLFEAFPVIFQMSARRLASSHSVGKSLKKVANENLDGQMRLFFKLLIGFQKFK